MNPERDLSHPAHRYPAVSWDLLGHRQTAKEAWAERIRAVTEQKWVTLTWTDVSGSPSLDRDILFQRRSKEGA